MSDETSKYCSREFYKKFGGENTEAIHGFDTLIGSNAGIDTLEGGSGHDTLSGRGENDILNGGSGNDIYIYSRGDGEDTIRGEAFDNGNGTNEDTILLTDLSQNDVEIYSNGTQLIINVTDDEKGKIIVENFFDDNGQETGISIENIK